MTKSIIVAMARNSVIGKSNSLPWRINADLKRFKQITMGHSIIMGRKTFESIGRALPGRTNIVISNNNDFGAPGCYVVTSIPIAIETARRSPGSEEVFFIGGASIYKQVLPLVDKIYMTFIQEHIGGDVFFPLVDWLVWKRISNEEILPNKDTDNHKISFLTYVKKGSH